jgi:hypothetical protein
MEKTTEKMATKMTNPKQPQDWIKALREEKIKD